MSKEASIASDHKAAANTAAAPSVDLERVEYVILLNVHIFHISLTFLQGSSHSQSIPPLCVRQFRWYLFRL